MSYLNEWLLIWYDLFKTIFIFLVKPADLDIHFIDLVNLNLWIPVVSMLSRSNLIKRFVFLISILIILVSYDFILLGVLLQDLILLIIERKVQLWLDFARAYDLHV